MSMSPNFTLNSAEANTWPVSCSVLHDDHKLAANVVYSLVLSRPFSRALPLKKLFLPYRLMMMVVNLNQTSKVIGWKTKKMK